MSPQFRGGGLGVVEKIHTFFKASLIYFKENKTRIELQAGKNSTKWDPESTKGESGSRIKKVGKPETTNGAARPICVHNP